MSAPLIVAYTRSALPFDRAVAARLQALLLPPEEEGPAALALPAPSLRVGPAELRRADLVLALDGDALAEAAEAGARRLALYLPRLDLAGLEGHTGLSLAERIYLPHASLIEPLLRAGARKAALRVVGLILPASPPADRRALKESLGLPAEPPAVVVSAEGLKEDLGASLVQLSLVSEPVSWLFDVGLDVALADRLRSDLSAYGLTAWLFAEGDEKAASARAAADVVLGRLRGPECPRALGAGVALALLPVEGPLSEVADALEAAGIASVADSSATLAVAIDAALRERERAREAIAALDLAGAPGRLLEALAAFAEGEDQARPEGLPIGLEPIGLERITFEATPTRSQPAPEAAPTPSPRERAKKSADEEIEDELAALRKRLGLDS